MGTVVWLLRRIGVSLALIRAVATIVFPALHLVPGDPAELPLSAGGVSPDPTSVANLRERLGMERPILAQYGSRAELADRRFSPAPWRTGVALRGLSP